MKDTSSSLLGATDTKRTIETIIKVGLLILLLIYCFMIIKPFLFIILWAIIIAMAVFPLYKFLYTKFKGHRKLSATIVTFLLLAAIIIPVILLGSSMADGISYLVNLVKSDNLNIPPPPAEVQSWPLVGKFISGMWQEASNDMEKVVFKYQPELKAFLTWFLSGATSAGLGFLKFLLSIVLSGIFLAFSKPGGDTLTNVVNRLIGTKGEEYVQMVRITVRNVANGIIGVSMIQGVMVGLGLLVAGVPGAGLWAFVAFLFCVIQVGMVPVVIPVLIYVFFTSSTLTFILLTAWFIPVFLVDTFLTPIVFGRNAPVPMLVVFLGSVGGFIVSGIIGLFVGAVVLTVGYKFFQVWLKEETALPVINKAD